MRNTILPFDELMKAVLEQLKSQKYMDSTLTVYRRTYKRIHIFLALFENWNKAHYPRSIVIPEASLHVA
ncbi:hypothetical protein FMM75_20190 [Lachnospiraceae bacterium MD335]|nr:hypothetical protein [Lachnospiraceae bacterium MD335]